MQQQAEIAWRVQAKCRQSHFDLLRNVLLCLSCADAERAAHYLYEREERCLLTIGRAASR